MAKQNAKNIFAASLERALRCHREKKDGEVIDALLDAWRASYCPRIDALLERLLKRYDNQPSIYQNFDTALYSVSLPKLMRGLDVTSLSHLLAVFEKYPARYGEQYVERLSRWQ